MNNDDVEIVVGKQDVIITANGVRSPHEELKR